VKLHRDFYGGEVVDVAQSLVGKWLVHGTRAGRIVEVEAYGNEKDKASHARFGPDSSRSSIMFGPPGFSYVYLIYGMYDCFNIVTGPDGSPSAILIRAVEPAGKVLVRTDGPGRLCRALGITRALHGLDLTGNALWLEDRGGAAPKIRASARIGVDYAGAWAKRRWRFFDADSKHVSKT
jgi:DNA-3-methyladenine glycosylase